MGPGQRFLDPHARDGLLDKVSSGFHDPHMKTSNGCLAGAIALALIVGGCATAKKEAPKTITWNTAMDAGLADAGKSGRPVLLDLYTDWCEWCKALDETTYTDPQFIEFSKRFTCVRVNAEVDTVTAARYRVRSYPTVLLLKPDGAEIDRVVGYYRAPEFMGQVEDYLAGRNTLASMVAAESTLGKNLAFLSKLADRYLEHGLSEEARTRYLRLVTLDPTNKSGLVDDALMSLSRMSRGDKDYATARKYAQTVLDRYSDSDNMKSAFLQVGINWKRSGQLENARKTFLDYAAKFPQDEDAPYAKEQADTLAAQIARKSGA